MRHYSYLNDIALSQARLRGEPTQGMPPAVWYDAEHSPVSMYADTFEAILDRTADRGRRALDRAARDFEVSLIEVTDYLASGQTVIDRHLERIDVPLTVEQYAEVCRAQNDLIRALDRVRPTV